MDFAEGDGRQAQIRASADEAFVGFMNPDFPHALDGLAQWCDAWSTRLLLFGLFGCLFLSYLVPRLTSWRIPATAFFGAWCATEIVVGTLKRVVGRPRPLNHEEDP